MRCRHGNPPSPWKRPPPPLLGNLTALPVCRGNSPAHPRPSPEAPPIPLPRRPSPALYRRLLQSCCPGRPSPALHRKRLPSRCLGDQAPPLPEAACACAVRSGLAGGGDRPSPTPPAPGPAPVSPPFPFPFPSPGTRHRQHGAMVSGGDGGERLYGGRETTRWIAARGGGIHLGLTSDL